MEAEAEADAETETKTKRWAGRRAGRLTVRRAGVSPLQVSATEGGASAQDSCNLTLTDKTWHGASHDIAPILELFARSITCQR